MPVEEMRRTVDWIIESSGRVDLINITGGEPTLHPRSAGHPGRVPPSGDRPDHHELERHSPGRGSGAVPAVGRAGRVRDSVVQHVRPGGESNACTGAI